VIFHSTLSFAISKSLTIKTAKPLLKLLFDSAIMIAIASPISGWFFTVIDIENIISKPDNTTFFISLLNSIKYIALWDFINFATHLFLHRTKLYYFHAVHHSVKDFTPVLTLYNHPVDQIFEGLIPVLVTTILLAPKQHAWIIANLVIMFISVNSHDPNGFDLASNILVGPKGHKLHHDNESFNYGLIFSIWDRLFKTYKTIK
jgi:sterol desaturase/sphingolipid hydroxylase (fatty acid hydroxylase superfamily)